MIPFSLIPEKPLYSLSKQFVSIGSFLSSLFPLLDTWLRQSEYSYSPREFASMAFAAALFNSIFLVIMVSIIGLLAQRDTLLVSIALGFFMLATTFSSVVLYPAIVSIRRARDIDYNLIHAVRQIVIELRSGVTLFSAIASATIEYGEVSKEFKKIVNKIESGSSELDVFSEASSTNPSLGMRRIFWQVSNALKVGSDVSIALETQLEDLTRERIEQIKRYGQELSPWVMMYMLVAVIFPSLGVTMLIVLTTFLNTALPPVIFPVILAILTGFQLFFMNLVGSRRPMI